MQPLSAPVAAVFSLHRLDTFPLLLLPYTVQTLLVLYIPYFYFKGDRPDQTMASATTTTTTSPQATPPTPTPPNEHEHEQEQEHEYWGYLFKPDKTGTDKLKALLRGLKDLIVSGCMHALRRVGDI